MRAQDMSEYRFDRDGAQAWRAVLSLHGDAEDWDEQDWDEQGFAEDGPTDTSGLTGVIGQGPAPDPAEVVAVDEQ
ncbi:MAG: hypothetical protein J0I49_14895 [Pseudonocardia sp.]|jgi:hypothetical protein|uniref:hypothetical protein n=1 Tax=Pseudonocardia sp. TaxID=60912 RepID=UPI001AC7CD1C|nr:hypothetical protein [Pseudonocardia sp.]MBN9099381.1 hypothetical protein [Pseudonocardia sp.]